jgi:hypothetical protein
MKYKETVDKIFGYVEEYKESPEKGTVTFELRRTEFNAEKLFALSDLLGTGTIEIEADIRYEGYCETCSYEYGVMILNAVGVSFDS